MWIVRKEGAWDVGRRRLAPEKGKEEGGRRASEAHSGAPNSAGTLLRRWPTSSACILQARTRFTNSLILRSVERAGMSMRSARSWRCSASNSSRPLGFLSVATGAPALKEPM